ncbi:hypothetical protein EBZ35_00600 [bacterium]|nr:hypothetical protein [bacterium]
MKGWRWAIATLGVMGLGLAGMWLGLVGLGHWLPNRHTITLRRTYPQPIDRLWDHIATTNRGEGPPMMQVATVPRQWQTITPAGSIVTVIEQQVMPPHLYHAQWRYGRWGYQSDRIYRLHARPNGTTEVTVTETSQIETPWVNGLMALTGRQTAIKQEMKRLDAITP